MSDLLQSTRGKIGIAVVGGLLVLAVAWFLLVSPQRSKANELAAQVSAAQSELQVKRLALAKPSAAVAVKPSDLYRLTKALPNETDMSGILLDVDRLATSNKISFKSISPSASVVGTGYTQQPLAIVVQGRFANVSSFLGDLRRLVTVRGHRLDARGRLYSVSRIDIGSPEAPANFPVVRASVTLNAYTFSNQAPVTAAPAAPTTTDASSGTVAAGANP